MRNSACCVRSMKRLVILTPARAFRLTKFASGSAHGLENNLLTANHHGLLEIEFPASRLAVSQTSRQSQTDRSSLYHFLPSVDEIAPDARCQATGRNHQSVLRLNAKPCRSTIRKNVVTL